MKGEPYHESSHKIHIEKAGIICLSTILFAMCSVLIYITKITGNMHRLDGSPEIPVMETNPNIPAEPMNMGSGYWTIAVFGVDSRNGDVGKGNHADVQLLCSINAATGIYALCPYTGIPSL